MRTVAILLLIPLAACTRAPATRKATAPPAQAPAAAVQTTPAQSAIAVSNSLGLTLQKGTEQSLDTIQQGRGWAIRDGECKYPVSVLARFRTVDPKIAIREFEPAESTVMIQVHLDSDARSSDFLSRIAQLDDRDPPALIDSTGREYPAIGFVARDGTALYIRYTRATPLACLNEAPALSFLDPGHHLTLLFNVATNAEIKDFRLGATPVETYNPPLKAVSTIR